MIHSELRFELEVYFVGSCWENTSTIFLSFFSFRIQAIFTGAELTLAHMARCRFIADELVFVGAVAPSPHYCGSGSYDEVSPSCILLPFTS